MTHTHKNYQIVITFNTNFEKEIWSAIREHYLHHILGGDQGMTDEGIIKDVLHYYYDGNQWDHKEDYEVSY